VDDDRIGVLGLSMGGEEALRAASESRAIAAVVADGAGASTTADSRAAGASSLERTVGWIGMRATELLSNDEEPVPLVTRVRTITAPVLLIASNAGGELEINREFAVRIGAEAELWHVDAGHTEALERHPGVYARHLRAFLASAL
jgi:pimeloyl-ACP methyl ester carboxylesterase